MIAIRISQELELEGEPSEFFNVVADIPHWYIWSTNFFHASLDSRFEIGARGTAIPKLYRIAPFIVVDIIKDSLIEIDFLISMSKINVTYEFISASKNRTKMKLTVRNASFYGWMLYFIRGKAFRRDFEKSIEAIGKQVLSLRKKK